MVARVEDDDHKMAGSIAARTLGMGGGDLVGMVAEIWNGVALGPSLRPWLVLASMQPSLARQDVGIAIKAMVGTGYDETSYRPRKLAVVSDQSVETKTGGRKNCGALTLMREGQLATLSRLSICLWYVAVTLHAHGLEFTLRIRIPIAVASGQHVTADSAHLVREYSVSKSHSVLLVVGWGHRLNPTCDPLGAERALKREWQQRPQPRIPQRMSRLFLRLVAVKNSLQDFPVRAFVQLERTVRYYIGRSSGEIGSV